MTNRILVIHNADRMWERLCVDLANTGYYVTNTEYKTIEFAEVQLASPDLIILDFITPHGGAGWIFLQLLKTEAALNAVPVLISTTARNLSSEIEDYVALQKIPVAYQTRDVDSLAIAVRNALASLPRREASGTFEAVHALQNPDKHVCLHCNHVTPYNSFVCEICGNPFIGTNTRRLSLADVQEDETLIGRAWGDAFIESLQPLILEIEGEQIMLPPQDELVLGRWSDSTNAAQPDIDLGDFMALQKGVSRRHALISRQDALVYLTDLDARNGTWLNGQRLESHNKRLLRDGDELRLGQLQMRIVFKQGEPQFESAAHRHGHIA
ncbi:MAG: FHA domain-containing protein [Aggregatilineales bacterium]